MKQVINKRGVIEVREVPAPVCGPGEVKIALTHSLISSGTELSNLEIGGKSVAARAKERPDLVKKVVDKAKAQGVMAAYRAVQEKLHEPKPLGYSAAGKVIEAGAHVTRFAPGDRVACGGSTAMHAEVVCVPENLVVRVPEGLEGMEAAFATVGSIAMQGIRRAQPEFGETFVVLGLGLVGQLCVQVAKAAGLRVIGFDTMPSRVETAVALGADAAYLLSDGNPVERVADATQGIGADCVVVAAATKSSEPVNTAMLMLRERGRVSIVGNVGMDFQRGPFYMKEIDVVMSRSYGPGRYDPMYEQRGHDFPIGFVRWTENRNMAEVLRMIQAQALQVAPLVTENVPIERAQEAYAALKSDESKPMAIILTYDGAAETASPRQTSAPSTRSGKSATGVAVVGCGAFAKTERLPYLHKMKNVRLAMLASLPGAQVEQLAAQYGVPRCTADYQEVLANPDVDLVVVASPHSTHGPIAIDAAKAGKDLLVEKPMAVNAEELEAVYAAVKESGVRYAIGFNRRFAPAAQQLKSSLDGLDEPKNMVYRCNVGLLAPGHWMHAPEEGGGRIVGEACHFFDFCGWLSGSAPVSVSAVSVSYEGAKYVGSDNLSSVVKYADGSTATIIYTTMGHTGLAKERVEVFCGGNAALLDDYKSLIIHGAPGAAWSSNTVDKGHKAMMEAFGGALSNGGTFPIGLDECYLSHLLTFKALEAARTGAVLSL